MRAYKREQKKNGKTNLKHPQNKRTTKDEVEVNNTQFKRAEKEKGKMKTRRSIYLEKREQTKEKQ